MEKIAIIGLSCLFPDAETPEQFWQNLITRKDSISLSTQEQMGVDPDIFYLPKKSEAGAAQRYYCKIGGYIKGFQFDPTGYQIPADILSHLDPLFQWSLYVAKQALYDSGYWDNQAVLAKAGVLLGSLSSPTQRSHHLVAPLYHAAVTTALQQLLQRPDLTWASLPPPPQNSFLNLLTAGYPSIVVAQALSLGGTSFSLDAACASSLYSVQLACEYLLARKADLMLAGGVSRPDPLLAHLGFSLFQAYPEDGNSRPLDQTSGGLMTSEGAGMLVLKRYQDAVRDGDKIYATILGVGLSNDGRGKHLLSPNPKGQRLAFERAYAKAGVSPATIEYVECHGTGTPLGDRTELNSMDIFFGQYSNAPRVGSVKSNLGHLLTAAGMPSILKVVLSMNHGQIPPTIKIEQPLSSPNQVITADQVVISLTPWQHPPGSSQRAAISSFGFGGTNSHLVLEHQILPDQSLSTVPETPIQLQKMAIVGMDAFFGKYEQLEAFERCIYRGEQTLIPVPEHRWQGLESKADLLQEYGFENGDAPLGAYIDRFEMDYLHFKIPPDDTDQPLPQQLLLLKVADNALRDSGLQEGANVAVIIAMGTEPASHRVRTRLDFSWQVQKSLEQANITLPADKLAQLQAIVDSSVNKSLKINESMSVIGNIMASRVAALWDFSGPAFTLSSEESSTFKALEVAQLLLSSDQLDAVVVGAVDLAGGAESVLLRHRQVAVNQGTPTLSYDQNSHGWMVGEGAGAVVLKRLDVAQQQQDRIYAVIDAVSLMQQAALTDQAFPPSASPVQVHQVCQQAFSQAGIQPTQVGYLEVAGTGIPQEDTAELEGLFQAYGRTDGLLSCAIGSVKANIGHTFVASGMASLIKTALCLYHKYLPATPRWSKPKQADQWQDSPFYVKTESHPWHISLGCDRRIAAINTVGHERSYAHVILSEAPGQPEVGHYYLRQQPFYLFPIAAHTQADLLAQVAQLQVAVAEMSAIANLASQYALQFEQTPDAPYAAVLLAHNPEELKRELHHATTGIPQAFALQQDWKTPLGSYFTTNPQGKKGSVAFVYPGGFTSYLGMARDLHRLYPKMLENLSGMLSVHPTTHELFHQAILRVYPRSSAKLTGRQLEQLEHEFLADSVSTLLAGANVAHGLTQLLRDCFQVKPQMAFGYSLGEFSMLMGMGVWQSFESLAQQMKASDLFLSRLLGPRNAVREYWGLSPSQEAADENFWSVYILMHPVEEVMAAIQGQAGVYLTHINTPEEVVIAGDRAACLRLIKTLQCNHFQAPFSHVIHCAPMQSELAELTRWFSMPVSADCPIAFYSAANYRRLTLNREMLGHSIGKMLCQPLDFPRLINQTYADGARIFIEIGSASTCTRWISATLKQQKHLTVNLSSRGMDDHTTVLRGLAKLVSHRVPLTLTPLYPEIVPCPKKKTVLKTVVLGGDRIEAKILTPANLRQFEAERLSGLAARTVHVTEDTKVLQPELIGATAQTVSAIPSLDSSRPLDSPLSPSHSLHSNSAGASISLTLPPPATRPQAMSSLPTRSHTDFLQSRTDGLRQLEKMLQIQVTPTQPLQPNPNQLKPVLETSDLLELAAGKIAPVFGEAYAIIDTYSHRIRLPMPPYLFLSRVTKIEAKRGCFEPCAIEAEYDIPEDPWYSSDGYLPAAILMEASHANMVLLSYLGIDFEHRGERRFRALDGSSRYFSNLPKVGQTLRCRVNITRFARGNGTLIYFFVCHYFIGDEKIMELQSGAGFFTPEELQRGAGITPTKAELLAKSKIIKQHVPPLLTCPKTQFDELDLNHFSEGNLAGCFGNAYQQPGRNPLLRLPPPALRMLDRVISVDPQGGAWGLGFIVGEKDLKQNEWYFKCHFKDDYCLPGTLIASGGIHLAQFFLLYLGLHTRTTDASFQPMLNLVQAGRTRGQILPADGTIQYQVEICEIGLEPEPYLKAELTTLYNGKVTSILKNVSIRLTEQA